MQILIGVISGIIGGLGMGGGTILILLLSVFQGIEQNIAQATNVIFFVPTAISAIFVNYRERNIEIKLAKTLSVFGILGAIIGAIISVNTDVQKLRKFYGIFLAIIAIHEIYTLLKEYKLHRKRNTKSS